MEATRQQTYAAAYSIPYTKINQWNSKPMLNCKENKVFSKYSDEWNILSEPTCNLANQTHMHFGHHFLSFIERERQILVAGDSLHTTFRQRIENLEMKPINSWNYQFSLIKWIYYNFDIEYREMQCRSRRLHPVCQSAVDKEASIDGKLIYSRRIVIVHHYFIHILYFPNFPHGD